MIKIFWLFMLCKNIQGISEPNSDSKCLKGWKHSLSKWNEFLADDLANSLDAPQEFFVQVCIVIYCFNTCMNNARATKQFAHT